MSIPLLEKLSIRRPYQEDADHCGHRRWIPVIGKMKICYDCGATKYGNSVTMQANSILMTIASAPSNPSAGSGVIYAATDAQPKWLGSGGVSTNMYSSGSGISSVTVTLSDADVKALYSTPKQMVAGPAAGFGIIPIHLLFSEVTLDTAYVVGGTLGLTYQSSNPTTLCSDPLPGAVLTGGSPVSRNVSGGGSLANIVSSGALYLGSLVSNPTGGEAANSVLVTVWYVTALLS